jgi:hypothetical protein
MQFSILKGDTMDLTKENAAYIDSLSYTELLRKWRFAPVGDDWFMGETGAYWSVRMGQLKAEGADHVAASKAIGWEKTS